MPGFHHSDAFFSCRFVVPVSRCRFRTPLPLPLPLPWLVGVDDWLASYGTEQRKNRTRSTKERLRQLFAIYGCNGTEFSYVIFTEQRNFTTAEPAKRQRNAAWKPGIMRPITWPHNNILQVQTRSWIC